MQCWLIGWLQEMHRQRIDLDAVLAHEASEIVTATGALKALDDENSAVAAELHDAISVTKVGKRILLRNRLAYRVER